ncbi:chemotaxis protein CheA [Nitrospirillum pindoramense]|uniref:Chemotaxis protein CheA n=1 Tax=Nitrospirillum amazonense TaxID=28077 RepID=A0A560HBQ7_9PROT|nr:chemotaxis protein CheA [Nitrospirillum amazonense]TWB43792.1 two-component system chemotaxis sensor kinase CheA [Nitrospirillum amazonense]
MDELLEQFLIEGPEQVQQAGEALLALEARPEDAALVDQAFRAIHTLKGSVGLFDLPAMAEVLHVAEDLLGARRDGRLTLSRAATDVLIAATGQTERWLDALRVTGGALPDDAGDVARALSQRLRGFLVPGTPVAGADNGRVEAALSDTHWVESLFREQASDAARHSVVTALRYTPDAGCYFRGEDPIALARAVPDLLAFRVFRRPDAPPASDAYDPYACDLVVELLSAAPVEAVKVPFRFMPDQIQVLSWSPPSPGPSIGPSPTGLEGPRGLRVDASRVDTLVALVDELVVAKNALADLAARMADGLAPDVAARIMGDRQAMLDRLIGRLHRTVTDIRLVPVLPLLRRFPRMVREMAAAIGKEADLVVDGQEVQADKGIVEGLFEPLTHLLRNAVDHGVEPAAERVAAGKPERARIGLTVGREGDRMVIEVTDDGRGMDPDRIRRTAAARGVVPAATLAELPDDQVLDLVFRPGFSTAEAVTVLSGRGVGMDAVRAAVGRLGGGVGLRSTVGAGTTVRLTLPMNLVLTKVLVVSVGDDRYGLPLDGVIETVRVTRDRVLPIRAGRAFVLRDTAVPLLALSDLLDQPADDVREGEAVRAVIVRVDGALLAVEVGTFLGRHDVVLRPMAGLLAAMPGLLGTTLLGDGGLLMVLDLPGLIAALHRDGDRLGGGRP